MQGDSLSGSGKTKEPPGLILRMRKNSKKQLKKSTSFSIKVVGVGFILPEKRAGRDEEKKWGKHSVKSSIFELDSPVKQWNDNRNSAMTIRTVE